MSATDLDLARKSWARLQALFALRGYELHRLTAGAGFRIARGMWSVDMQSMGDVLAFAERAGIEVE